MLEKFREMSIQNKLFSSVGVSLLSIVVVWILISKIIGVSNHAFKEAKTMLEESEAIGNTTGALRSISEPAGSVLVDWNTMKARERFDQNLQNYEKEAEALQKILINEKDPSIIQNIQKMDEGAARVSELSKKIFIFADEKVTADGEGKMFAAQAAMENGSALMSEINMVNLEALEAMEETETYFRHRTLGLFDQSIKSNKQFSLFSLTVLLISVVLTTVVSFFIARSISRPVKSLQNVVESIRQGDLNVNIDTKSYGEIGALTKGVAAMIEGLKSGERQKVKMARVSAMIENAGDNFMFADKDFNIVYMNPASTKTLQKIEHLLPYRANEIIGKNIDNFHKDPARVRKILRDDQSMPYEGTIQLGDEFIELTANAIYDHNNEWIGTMANWRVVTMKAKLKESLGETSSSLASASEQLEDASTEMRMSAEETSRQAKTVAEISDQTNKNVQNVAAAAEEMSVTVREISRNVQEATKISSDAVSKANIMNDMITKLDHSSHEIGKVVEVITMIAEQTNLLALNATIEAARAGEAGKGFAVVASEVKDLAKGTAKATEEIREQITSIQDSTKDAVGAIEEITEIIQHNNEISVTISGAVEEQSTTTNVISQNMADAARGTDEVVRDINDILSTSEDAATSADHIQGASKKLSEMSSRMSTLLVEGKSEGIL